MLAFAVDFETDQHRPRAFRLAENAHRRFRDDAELPLRPDDEREEIITLGIEMLAADFDDRPVHHHHLDAEHVVGRHAILQTVRTTRVHRNVAG